MKPEDLAAIAARNAATVERVQESADEAKKDSFLTQAGDTATQLDILGDAAHAAFSIGNAVWDATCAVGSGVGGVCKAVGSLLPD